MSATKELHLPAISNILPGMKKTLELRVDELERRLAAVESAPASKKQPAWVKHGGWAAGDPLHEEAMKLGAQWRKRQNRKPLGDAGRR